MPATTITVPAGRTDATISNIATGPVPNNGGGSVGIIGDLFAGFANGREQNSFGILPILYGTSLSNESVVGGTSVNATVTLLSAAPAGGTVVRLQGSMEGQVIVPQSVTIPAGSISATFTTTPAPETPFPRWVFIQGSYGTSGGLQARILEIDPAPGPATVLAIGPASQDVIGGHSGRTSVALVIPAPAGGGV